MKEYRVVVSIFNDLLTAETVRRKRVKECGCSTSIHVLQCNNLEEIPDLFLNVCGDECAGMTERIYWYVDAGNGWVQVNL